MKAAKFFQRKTAARDARAFSLAIYRGLLKDNKVPNAKAIGSEVHTKQKSNRKPTRAAVDSLCLERDVLTWLHLELAFL